MTDPEPLTARALPDPTYFEGRYPEPDEILRNGGLCGVEYCFVSGVNQRKFTDAGWSMLRDLPVISIAGPKGTVETVVVMGRGEPVTGASDDNGIRQWYVDYTIERDTGLSSNPDEPITNNTENGAGKEVIDASKAGKK